MALKTKRYFVRNYNETPILLRTIYDYARYKQEDYYYTHAKMGNNSIGGMYFELGYAIQPGSDVYIKMVNHTPDDTYCPEAFRTLRAKVKWCREIENNESSHYGVGVQYHDVTN